MALITEEECRRRIANARAADQEHIDELSDALKKAEFRAAVAEWAVAGVLAKNLQLRVAIDDRGNDLIDATRHLGARAGAEFLERADLAFRAHAEMMDLRTRLTPMQVTYRCGHTTDVPSKFMWPMPFRSKT